MVILQFIAIIFCAELVAGAVTLLKRRMLDNLTDIREIIDEETGRQVASLVREAFAPGGIDLSSHLIPLIALYVADHVLSHLGAPLALYVIGMASVVPVCVFVLVQIARRRIRPFIWQKLAERGVIVCLHCGYDLRGQTVCRCPECGKAFDPQRLTLKKGVMYAVDCWRERK